MFQSLQGVKEGEAMFTPAYCELTASKEGSIKHMVKRISEGLTYEGDAMLATNNS